MKTWTKWSSNTHRTQKEAGLDGVVCSPLEAGKIHETCGGEFLTVTPGVRFADAAKDDQVRITTPEGAKKNRLRLHRSGKADYQS